MRESPRRYWEHGRRIQTADALRQAGCFHEVLVGAPPHVLDAAKRIGRGEVVPDDAAEAVVAALTDRMLDDDGFDGQALTARGVEIDDLLGIVQQMGEHFYN